MPLEKTNSSATSLLRNRFIRVILIASCFMQIGIWIRNFAILLFVVSVTDGDAFAVSLISVAEFLPIFIFSFIGGAFADRWKPKRTMIWCDLLSALSVFLILITLIYTTWKVVFFVTFISATLSQFSQPLSMKLFKKHLSEEQMQKGMSLFQTIISSFMIFGPILGTFIFEQFGIHVSMALVGMMFLLSAMTLMFIPKDQNISITDQESSVWMDMKVGFKYVWVHQILRTLGFVFMVAGLGLGLIRPLSIFLITERLHLDKEYLQWLFAVDGAAMIIGGVIVMIFSSKIVPQKIIMVGMAIMTVGIFMLGSSTVFWVTLITQFIIGLFTPGLLIGINTIILNNTEENFVGRVNGILTPLFTGTMVISMSISGLLKEQFSLFTIYQFSAIFFIIGILVMIPIMSLRNNKVEVNHSSDVN